MAILHRKIAADGVSLYNCTLNTNCEGSSALVYCWNCVYLPPPPLPLLPPPPPPDPGHNHATPYLVSAVCALGVAFLILTTCGILLRCRWWRRRNSTPPSLFFDDDVFIDEDQGQVDHPIWRIVTVGLPDSVIESITAVKFGKADRLFKETDCSVCLTEFEEGDDLRLLPKCNHAFHISCIDTWLRSHQNCPLCRSAVVNLSSGGSARVENPLTRLDENVDEGEEQEDEEEEGPRSIVGLGGGNPRIREILKNDDWGKRALSDLGENHRVGREVFEIVRRTISMDASASSAMHKAAVAIDIADHGEQKLEHVVEEGASSSSNRGESSISRLMKSSPIGRSLQKAPVSMKRSFSSGAKILSSFRGTKNQPSSSLPL